MSDVENTKRSEKSLQPYRFLLNGGSSSSKRANEWKKKEKEMEKNC